MNSEKQQAVISFLLDNKTATARQIAKVLGRDSKAAWNIIAYMLRAGRIKRCGPERYPEYRLAPRWQEKVKQPKRPKAKPAPQPVTQICRQNWQGYNVHKIFGSARP